MTVFCEVHFYSRIRIKESLKNSGFQWYIIESGGSSLMICGIILDLEPENIKKIYYSKYQWKNKRKILRFIPHKLKDRINSYSYNIVKQITGFMILSDSYTNHKITFNPSIDPELIIKRFRSGTTAIIS